MDDGWSVGWIDGRKDRSSEARASAQVQASAQT